MANLAEESSGTTPNSDTLGLLEPKLASLLERLLYHKNHVTATLLIQEAIDTLTEQNATIHARNATIKRIDAALCNFLNNCEDPYDPEPWLDSIERDFNELKSAYQDWHKDDSIWNMTFGFYLMQQEAIRAEVTKKMLEIYYEMVHAKDSADVKDIVLMALAKHVKEKR